MLKSLKLPELVNTNQLGFGDYWMKSIRDNIFLNLELNYLDWDNYYQDSIPEFCLIVDYFELMQKTPPELFPTGFKLNIVCRQVSSLDS